MRRDLARAELRLWLALRGGALDGLHFRNQHPVDPYIFDFYCSRARLAVEVDGSIHDEDRQADYDARRDRWMADRGIRTLRVRDLDVFADVAGVAEMIRVLAWERIAALDAEANRRTR